MCVCVCVSTKSVDLRVQAGLVETQVLWGRPKYVTAKWPTDCQCLPAYGPRACGPPLVANTHKTEGKSQKQN